MKAPAAQDVRVFTYPSSPRKWRRRVAIDCGGVSRTQQNFAAECDINNLMRKYEKTGTLPQLQGGRYDDFSDPKSYQECLNSVLHAESQFATLPSRLRERFLNDPAKFLEFATDSKNVDEMVSLGLAVKRQRSNDDETRPSPEALQKTKSTEESPKNGSK